MPQNSPEQDGACDDDVDEERLASAVWVLHQQIQLSLPPCPYPLRNRIVILILAEPKDMTEIWHKYFLCSFVDSQTILVIPSSRSVLVICVFT